MTAQETIQKLKELHSYFYQFNDDRSSSICEAVMCALSAVEKQMMKEPKVTINEYGARSYFCPHCARPLTKSCSKGEPRYCVDCGQAVKWDD